MHLWIRWITIGLCLLASACDTQSGNSDSGDQGPLVVIDVGTDGQVSLEDADISDADETPLHLMEALLMRPLNGKSLGSIH